MLRACQKRVAGTASRVDPRTQQVAVQQLRRAQLALFVQKHSQRTHTIIRLCVRVRDASVLGCASPSVSRRPRSASRKSDLALPRQGFPCSYSSTLQPACQSAHRPMSPADRATRRGTLGRRLEETAAAQSWLDARRRAQPGAGGRVSRVMPPMRHLPTRSYQPLRAYVVPANTTVFRDIPQNRR